MNNKTRDRNQIIYDTRREFNKLKDISKKIADYDNCINKAITHDIIDIVEYFILHFGANYILQTRGMTLLGCSIRFNRYKIAQLLINSGSDVNIADSMKISCFNYCIDEVEYSDNKIINLIISNEKFIFTKKDLIKICKSKLEKEKKEEIILEILKNKKIAIYNDIIKYARLYELTEIINYAINNFTEHIIIPKELVSIIFSFL
jgi:hypothetical protein